MKSIWLRESCSNRNIEANCCVVLVNGSGSSHHWWGQTSYSGSRSTGRANDKIFDNADSLFTTLSAFEGDRSLRSETRERSLVGFGDCFPANQTLRLRLRTFYWWRAIQVIAHSILLKCAFAVEKATTKIVFPLHELKVVKEERRRRQSFINRVLRQRLVPSSEKNRKTDSYSKPCLGFNHLRKLLFSTNPSFGI